MNHRKRTDERRLISIEGGDGAGKTTTSRLVYDHLVRAKIPVVIVQPKHPHFQEQAVESFMTSMLAVLRGPRHLLTAEQWLHLTSTWYHVISEHIVRPALRRREMVIADTWYYKPLVRYGLLGQSMLDEARRCFADLAKPELTCLLDIDPEVAASRKSAFGFGETGNFERPAEFSWKNFVTYQRRFRGALSTIAQEEGWHIINAGQFSPELVAGQILEKITDRGWI